MKIKQRCGKKMKRFFFVFFGAVPLHRVQGAFRTDQRSDPQFSKNRVLSPDQNFRRMHRAFLEGKDKLEQSPRKIPPLGKGLPKPRACNMNVCRGHSEQEYSLTRSTQRRQPSVARVARDTVMSTRRPRSSPSAELICLEENTAEISKLRRRQDDQYKGPKSRVTASQEEKGAKQDATVGSPSQSAAVRRGSSRRVHPPGQHALRVFEARPRRARSPPDRSPPAAEERNVVQGGRLLSPRSPRPRNPGLSPGAVSPRGIAAWTSSPLASPASGACRGLLADVRASQPVSLGYHQHNLLGWTTSL